MVRSNWLAVGAALMALAHVGNAHGQSVHKCIVNGAVVYQAGACPAANEEKSLVLPPPPSQQELLDATANARLQNYQANSGNLVTPSQRRYDRRYAAHLTPSLQEAPTAAQNNCERLNQAFHEAEYRRDELQAPGTGATRADALQRAKDDIARTSEQAALTHCQLR